MEPKAESSWSLTLAAIRLRQGWGTHFSAIKGWSTRRKSSPSGRGNPSALGHDVSHSSAHAPEMKPEQKQEQAVTPQREQSFDIGLGL